MSASPGIFQWINIVRGLSVLKPDAESNNRTPGIAETKRCLLHSAITQQVYRGKRAEGGEFRGSLEACRHDWGSTEVYRGTDRRLGKRETGSLN